MFMIVVSNKYIITSRQSDYVVIKLYPYKEADQKMFPLNINKNKIWATPNLLRKN